MPRPASSNNEPVQLELTGEEVTVLRIDDITPLPGPGLISGVATLESKRDAIAAFVARPLRAMARDQRDDPRSGWKPRSKRSPDLGHGARGAVGRPVATIDAWAGTVQQADGLGAIDTAGWTTSIDYLTELGLVPNPVTVDDVLDRASLTRRRLTGVLAGVRPSGARRSWWLREALAAEVVADPALADAAPPLRGTTTADVAILGGGYTGLWTALRLAELAPGARIVAARGGHLRRRPVRAQRRVRDGLVGRAADAHRAVRRGRCARGRLGDRRGGRRARSLVRRARGRRLVHESRDAVGQRRAGPGRHAGWRRRRPAHRSGCGDRYVALGPATTSRRASPRRCCAAGRSCRVPRRSSRPSSRVACDGRARTRRRRSTRARVSSSSTASGRAGWARSGPGRDGPRPAVPVARSGSARRRPRAAGEVIAGSAVVALNAWAAAWPSFGRRLVTWSSYIVLTEPIPDRLEEIGWTGGEGLADARFTLHYLRTTRDGRIAIGGGGGRAGFGGRIGAAFTDDANAAARAAAGLRRLFPIAARTCGSRTRGAARSTSPPTTCRASRPCPAGRSTSPTATRATASRPRSWPGGSLAGLAARDIGCPGRGWRPAGRRRPWSAAGRRAFPPEPFRYLGARVVREAIVRREAPRSAGERVAPLLREVTRLPRRLGYHLSPD